MRYLHSPDELKDAKNCLLFFYSTTLEPAIAELIFSIVRKFDPVIDVIGINFPEFPTLKDRFKIEGIPTIIWMKNLREKKRILGFLAPNELNSMIDEISNDLTTTTNHKGKKQ
jgi:hypothetical protein